METVVVVSCLVKHYDPVKARAEVERRMNEWYNEDIGREAPYPDKSLLHYTIVKTTPIVRERG